MNFFQKLNLTAHRWTHWEYWPSNLAIFPVVLYYLWLAMRARRLFFFSNINPKIPLGGVAGESKMDILKMLPAEILPKSLFFEKGKSTEKLTEKLASSGIFFPIVAKPDIGERGFLVKICQNENELREHIEKYPADFILQEFLEMPEEFTVLFHHFPNGNFGVTSICQKEMLAVVGDGKSTVRELMMRVPRAAFQLKRFENDFQKLLEKVPAAGEKLVLERIGNHIRGTAFLNANHLIDKELTKNFRQICLKMEGIRYGRFDLKSESAAALKMGQIKVMELNGVLGEPAHIYDPNFGAARAYRDYFRHWRIIFELHRAQKKAGVESASVGEAVRILRGYFRYKKDILGS